MLQLTSRPLYPQPPLLQPEPQPPLLHPEPQPLPQSKSWKRKWISFWILKLKGRIQIYTVPTAFNWTPPPPLRMHVHEVSFKTLWINDLFVWLKFRLEVARTISDVGFLNTLRRIWQSSPMPGVVKGMWPARPSRPFIFSEIAFLKLASRALHYSGYLVITHKTACAGYFTRMIAQTFILFRLEPSDICTEEPLYHCT